MGSIKFKYDDKEEIYSIFLLNMYNDFEYQTILKRMFVYQENDEGNLTCSCDEVPMKVFFDNGRYFINSEIGKTSKHEKKCYFSKSVKVKSNYELGWEYVYMGGYKYYQAQLSNLYFSKKRYDKLNNENLNNGLTDRDGKLTFRGFIVKFNLLARENFFIHYQRNPYSYSELSEEMIKVSQFIIPEKKKTRTLLDYLLVPNEDIKTLPDGTRRFVYGKIVGIKKEKEDITRMPDVLLKIKPFNSHKVIHLKVDGLIFLEGLKHSFEKPGKDNSPFFAGILVFHKGKFEVNTGEIILTSKTGVFAENKEEQLIMNELDKQQTPYFKPTNLVAEFNYEIPNIIIKEDSYSKYGFIDIDNKIEVLDDKIFTKY